MLSSCLPHWPHLLLRSQQQRHRDQLPERAGAQVEEGQRQVASALGRHDPAPVGREALAQLGRDLDPVGAQASLADQVKHGQEQEGFMRGAGAGQLGPAAGAVAAQVGELVDVFAQLRIHDQCLPPDASRIP